MKTIIINGANGYVASNFISKLLTKNYKVIALVRAGKNISPEQRMRDALAENSELNQLYAGNLTVYNYSLFEKDFSIPRKTLEEMFKDDVEYFHFAASLKYNLKSKDEIFETNVDGVKNSLEIYSKYATKSSRFFFIGTAYSCGKFEKSFKERFYANQDISYFRNYYEQSKRFAENVVKKFIGQKSINVHILRLSQVVGHNQSGVTKTDYGIFDFTRRVFNLAYRYPYETVRVKIDPEATQNLIPIDTVVRYLMGVVNIENLPVIMNFVAKKQLKNIQIINSI
ncbi:MAG TPA: SDR family oxidoreductase, partial [Bacteroidales bacterium]|nr:SDR family oxidoreductase [Bacteroidales bacterium]